MKIQSGRARAATLRRSALATALLVLLLVNIRNAWDLALALARRQTEHNRQWRANPGPSP
jgi:hypothetical protein